MHGWRACSYLTIGLLSGVVACGDDAGDDSPDRYTLGGTVTGLASTGLTLRDQGGAALAVTADGPFAFPDAHEPGYAYAVTVDQQPTGAPSQTCSVDGGAGTVGDADVTSIAVRCMTNTYVIGGTLTGLAAGTITLENAGADPLELTADGAFRFAAPVPSGGTCAVAIRTLPSDHQCLVSAGAGPVTDADIASVVVDCAVTGQQVFDIPGQYELTVPRGVTRVTLAAYGAQGRNNTQNSTAAARGGFASGTRTVTPGEVLHVFVGGGGGTGASGGFNGGADGNQSGAAPPDAACAGAGGGGASDVRAGGAELADRVLVAGGGGGDGGFATRACAGSGGGGGGGYHGGGGGATRCELAAGGGSQAGGGAGGSSWFVDPSQRGHPGTLGAGGGGGISVALALSSSVIGDVGGGAGGGLSGDAGHCNQPGCITCDYLGGGGGGGASFVGGVEDGVTMAGLRAGNGQVTIGW